jgi:hypothetical protein
VRPDENSKVLNTAKILLMEIFHYLFLGSTGRSSNSNSKYGAIVLLSYFSPDKNSKQASSMYLIL